MCFVERNVQRNVADLIRHGRLKLQGVRFFVEKYRERAVYDTAIRDQGRN